MPKIQIEIEDVYEEIENEISAKQDDYDVFVNRVLKDPILKKLWEFAFLPDPLKESNYPLAEKAHTIDTIEQSDLEHLQACGLNDSEKNNAFYDYLWMNLVPLWFALKVVKQRPGSSLSYTLELLRQEIVVKYFDDEALIKKQRVSYAQMPGYTTVITSEKDREIICLEFSHKIPLDTIRYLDNYSFGIFQRFKRDADILWGESNRQYLIQLTDGKRPKSFPFPIFSKAIKFINDLLKARPLITSKILHAEQEPYYDEDGGRSYVIMQAMRRKFLEGARKFKRRADWRSYFIRPLSGDDNFKKASTQATIMDNKDGGNKPKLKSKLEHSGGSINIQGAIDNKFREENDENYEIIPPELQEQKDEDSILSMVTLSELIEILDDQDGEIINLYLEDLSQAEIAQILEINQATVSRQLKEIIKKLKKFNIPA